MNWKKTKIQIVAHGDPKAKTVGGLSPDKLADVVNKLTKGESTKVISIVSCISNSGDIAYLKEFVNALEAKNIHSMEISARSALIVVDRSGSKWTGKIYYNEYIRYNSHHNPMKDIYGKPIVEKSEAGILWSHKDKAVKWIAKLLETEYHYTRAPITDNRVTQYFFGFVPKGQDVSDQNVSDQNVSDQNVSDQNVSDHDAFQILDAEAKNVYKKAKSSKPTNEKEYCTLMVTNMNGRPQFAERKMMLREINGYEDFLNEIRYRSDEFNTNPSTDTVHYRFGSFVVSMSLENLYLKVDGIINSNNFSLSDIKNMWPDVDKGYSFSKVYKQMKPATGADFIQQVISWIAGKNDDIETTPANFIKHAYNAQCGAAMFLAESIRNFHNHITNMWVLDMIDRNITKEQFFSKDILPMARAGTWMNKKTGTKYMDSLEAAQGINKKKAKRYLEEIKNRLSRITKTYNLPIPIRSHRSGLILLFDSVL